MVICTVVVSSSVVVSVAEVLVWTVVNAVVVCLVVVSCLVVGPEVVDSIETLTMFIEQSTWILLVLPTEKTCH